MPTNPSAAQPLKPLPAMTAPGARPAHMQPKPPMPGQPNFQQTAQQMQQNTWKPSVVAQIAAQKGDPMTAFSQGSFKPQVQQPGAQMKTANGPSCCTPTKPMKPKMKAKPKIETTKQIEDELSKASQFASLLGKEAAVVAVNSPKPKDWNGWMTMPTVTNGGIGSYGENAWHSVNHFKHPKGDQMNIRKDFNVRN